MAPTNVELYEALKQTVGSDAARMIAEVVPSAADLATRGDIVAEVGLLRTEMNERFAGVRSDMNERFADVRSDMNERFAEVRVEIATLRGEMHAETTRNIKWMLGFFIPVWAGTWAAVAAVLLKP